MLVQEVMQAPVITVTPVTTVPEGVRIVQTRGVRHLPVVAYGKLVGIVSDRDLERAIPSPATTLERHDLAMAYPLKRLTMAEVMTRPVLTISPLFPIEEAAQLMVANRVSALPVTESGQLRGILTETDVLRLLARVVEAWEPSSRVDVMLKPQPRALTDMVSTVEAAGMTVSSITILTNPAGVNEATIRFTTIDPAPAIKALEVKGYTVRNSWPRLAGG